MPKFTPIEMPIGSQWGKWTVLGLSHSHPISGNRYYDCVCSCGSAQKVEGSRLRKGKSTQCKSCSSRANGRKGLYSKGSSSKFLYFIRVNDYVKIGVSSNPERRLNDLQGSCPYPAEIIWVEENTEGLEEFYHTLYEDRHHRGEWFLLKENSCEI